MKKELIQIRTTENIKQKLQAEADNLELSLSQYILKCVEDKRDLVMFFEAFKREIVDVKDKIDTSFYYLKQDTDSLMNKENEDIKSYITIKIDTENLIKSDIIIIKGNVLEVIKNDKEDKIIYANNLLNDKKLQVQYQSFTEDVIIKRRA